MIEYAHKHKVLSLVERDTGRQRSIVVDSLKAVDLTPILRANTIEGAFSIFKRGTKGVYQHCTKKHLHRYVAEFEFR